MLPLAAWPLAERRTIRGVFTDIDDTLTTEGVITPEALVALGALRAAGLRIIPVTGRPVGWSEPFARGWPVDAIVAENGAVALCPDAGGLRKIYQQEPATRAAHYARMQAVARRIEAEVPGAARSQDSPGRETDIAIDHSEFTQLPASAIAQVVATMRAAGMQATVSSIHINGWYGDHNKLSGARWILRELCGHSLDDEIDHWLYVGDSTNDERMFEYFTHSVGVANIARFVAQMQHLPRYVTRQPRGAGFAEVAQALLEARG